MSRMSLYSRQVWREIRARSEEPEMPSRTKEQTPEQWIEQENERMQLAAERQAIDALLPYWENQQAEARFKSEKEACGRIIKAFLETHDVDELADAERGVRAMLQTRKLPNENWDISRMPDELILRLAKAGCLVADKKAMELKGHQALRMDAEKWFIPAGETVALRVVKE